MNYFKLNKNKKSGKNTEKSLPFSYSNYYLIPRDCLLQKHGNISTPRSHHIVHALKF